MTISLEQAKGIVTKIIQKSTNRFKQELVGSNDELMDRVIRQFRGAVARHSWKSAQKWSKWSDEGPVLMPDYTRIYYRVGATEVVLQEFPPQTRLMQFTGSLVKSSDEAPISDADYKKVHSYSLALPFLVFIFKFENGKFNQVRCMFSDRPLKNLEENPIRPYLANIDAQFPVCLGKTFDHGPLEVNNISQQTAYVLSYFWSSVYTNEWATHFWANQSHFKKNDPRLASLDAWQEASTDNPLFVIEDVPWLRHTEANFGDIIVRMFEEDKVNNNFREELYEQLSKDCFSEIKQTFSENVDSLEENIVENLVTQLAQELMEQVN